jgi:hypothetical protein
MSIRNTIILGRPLPDVNNRRTGGHISVYVKAMIRLRGGAAWGPPAGQDRMDFLGNEGVLPGDRRGRTPTPNQMIT